MQVTELKQEGLQREYKVVIEAETISVKLDSRLSEIAKTAEMRGFRKGMVPLPILKKRYNAELLQEILRDTINDSTQKIIEEQNLRPAVQPDINLAAFNEGANLEYTVAIEIFPEVTLPDFSALKLEKLVPEVGETDIEEGLQRLAAFYKDFVAPAVPRPAALGDVVIIDFEGTIDGVPFEGGKSQDFRLELGSKQFIDTFEEQLVGSNVGETRALNVTFPENYHHQPLAGKAAVFTVTVKEILEGNPAEVNEAFAKKFNFDTVEALKDTIKERIVGECESIARTKLKKELFDLLETRITFPIPSKMVALELESLIQALKQEQEENPQEITDAQKEEYQKIAERRVKLGILLAETSKVNSLTVSQDELKQAVFAQARNYPGQEPAVIDYYRKNPAAIEQLKGPILEEKAVDFIVSQADVSEKPTAVKEIMQALDEVSA